MGNQKLKEERKISDHSPPPFLCPLVLHVFEPSLTPADVIWKWMSCYQGPPSNLIRLDSLTWGLENTDLERNPSGFACIAAPPGGC